MTFEEAKEIFINRGYEQVDGGSIYNADKWRDSVIVISDWLQQEPCEDAISREDALHALCQAVHKNDDSIPCSNQRISCLWNKTKVQDYAEEILKLPPIMPQPKTGHWISDGRNKICSECNFKIDTWHDTDIGGKRLNYCPDCGIKMEIMEVEHDN